MKRGFFFGLGSFFMLLAITGLAGCAGLGEPDSDGRISSGIAALISYPVSGFVINKAIAAPPNDSKFRGVLGWFIGFFTPYEVGLALTIASGYGCLNNSLFAYKCFTH
jgi:hypothetical protein